MLRWVSLLALISMAAAGQEARDLRTQKIAPVLPGGQTRWALVIGVSTYKYVPPAAQLRFAHRDAEDFAKLLRSREGGGLPASNVRLLTEEAATVGAIRAAVRTWLPQSAGANDVVYLYFAGHAVAAMSISLPTQRLRGDILITLKEQLLKAANQLSSELGYVAEEHTEPAPASA